VFIREATGYLDNSNHFGSCVPSMICAIFDYSNNQGFDTVANAEMKCKKCIGDN